MRRIDHIAIHCSATPEGRDFNAEDIKRWHKALGWSDIGYHYVACLDGTTQKGRPEEIPGAHVERRLRPGLTSRTQKPQTLNLPLRLCSVHRPRHCSLNTANQSLRLLLDSLEVNQRPAFLCAS